MPKQKTIILISTAIVVIVCVVVGILFTGINTSTPSMSDSYEQQDDQDKSTLSENQQEDATIPDDTSASDEERTRLMDEQKEKAAHNPAVVQILHEGDAESVPIEHVANVQYLSSLPQEYIDRSLLYIGNYLTKKGYDPDTVDISILEGIDDYDCDEYVSKVFYFQVTGENAVYCVTVADSSYRQAVSVHSTADKEFLSMATKDMLKLLSDRGYI